VKSLRVLIVRIGAMGDVLHAMPAVAALRALHPDAFIGWALEPRWADLLQMSGDEEDLSQGIGKTRKPALIDRWYSVPAQKWAKHPLSGDTLNDIVLLKELLREEHFDVVVDLQGSLKSAVVGRLTGVRRFAGPDEPREAMARKLYRERLTISKPHVVEQACELLGGALGEALEPARVIFPMQPEHELWAEREIGKERFCLIAPTAGWGAKEWPPERYGDLAQELSRLGYSVLVNASSGADDTAHAVARASGGVARILPCSVGQMIAAIRRAELVIGGDTGPVHLAAALEHPVVAIYGPTNPARNGPWGTRSRVLRHPESVTSHKRVREAEPGMLHIRVGEVLEASMDMLGISDDGWRGSAGK
jgi:heptosyltransferase-1